MKRLTPATSILLIAVLCIATRLPAMLSSKMLLDPDESVVALMAKHMWQGKEFPLFFWGQQYGFSLIEELFILPFYSMMGVTAIAVKSAMLTLFIIGVIYQYKALCRINHANKYVPLILTLLFITVPAWAEWSMKARGGYLTAFTLSSVLLFRLFKKEGNTWQGWIVNGMLLALIYESMILWFPGMLLFCIYFLIRQKNIAKAAGFILTTVILLTGFHFYTQTLPNFHVPEAYSPPKDWPEHLLRVPAVLYHSLHGNYFFFDLKPVSPIQSFTAFAYCVLILAVVIMSLAAARNNRLLLLTVMILVSAIMVSILPPDMHFRYLLPVTGYFLVALQLLLNQMRMRTVYYGIAGILIITGIVSVVQFKDYSYTVVTESSMKKAVNYMLQRHIYYTFCNDAYVAWQLNFYANEKVICREQPYGGRYLPYHQKIDAALDSGQPTALVGLSDDYFGLNVHGQIYFDYIYVMENMPKSELSKNFGFTYK